MIDAIIHDATRVFIALAVIDTVFVITWLVGAIRKPKHYKLNKGKL